MNTIKININLADVMTRYKITKEQTIEVGGIILPEGVTIVPVEHGLQICLHNSDMAPYFNLRGIQNNVANLLANFKPDLEGVDTIIIHENISCDICPRKDLHGKKLWKFWVRKEETVFAQDPHQFAMCEEIFECNK